MMDLRQRWDVLVERRAVRQPLLDRVRDTWDHALDRWLDLPLAGRVALGTLGLLALAGGSLGAYAFLQPVLTTEQLRTTPGVTVPTELGTTTSIPLTQLLETPVTEPTTTTTAPVASTDSTAGDPGRRPPPTTRPTRAPAAPRVTRAPTPTTRRPPTATTPKPTTPKPTTPPPTAPPVTAPPATSPPTAPPPA